MLRMLALALAIAAFAASAHAEPFSVRCDNPHFIPIRQPYFVTFDIPANRLILESPKGNLLKGQILSTDDDKLELSLEVRDGRMLLTFFPKTATMRWPGLPAQEFGRAPMDHVCKAVADRTTLSAGSPSDQADFDPPQSTRSFSLRCPDIFDQFFFITMDRVTKGVLLETAGMPLLGKITNIDGGKISFSLAVNDRPMGEAVWDEQSQILTGTGGLANSPGRFSKPLQCTTGKARSVMELYDRLP